MRCPVTLPTEIWDKILDRIPYNRHRYRTLYNLCLASPSLCTLAQPALFSWITDRYDDIDYKVFTRFTRTVWRFPHLGRYVHTLDIVSCSWEDFDSESAKETNRALGKLNKEIRKGIKPHNFQPVDSDVSVPAIVTDVDADHIMFLSALCPNLRRLTILKHDDLELNDLEVSTNIWANLREVRINDSGSGCDLDELAGLLAAPSLESAYIEGCTWESNLCELGINTSVRKLAFRNSWLSSEHLEPIMEAFPSLESFEFNINPDDNLFISNEFLYNDHFTPREAVGALSKVRKTLRHLKLDLFDFWMNDGHDREILHSHFVAGSLCRLSSLETLTIDAKSILGYILFDVTASDMLRHGFEHADRPLKDFFPKSLRELSLIPILPDMYTSLKWLASHVREELPDLQSLLLGFAQWPRLDQNAEWETPVPQRYQLHLLPNIWRNIIRDFLHAGVELSLADRSVKGYQLQVSEDMLDKSGRS